MWKKTFLALGLAGLLALPVGAAMAVDDDVTGAQPLVTVDQDRDSDQVRDRIQDPAECGNCPGSENPPPAMTGDRDRDRTRLQDPDETAIPERDQTRLQERDQTRLQERDQTRLQDPDHTAVQEREQTRLQERDCDGEPDGARLQEQVRTQTRLQNQATHQGGTDSAGSNRNGEGNRQGQDG